MSDFTEVFGEWLAGDVSLRRMLGQSAEGVVHGDPIPVVDQDGVGVAVEHKRRLVLDSQGRQAISETTIYAPAGTPEMSPGDIVVIGTVEATVIRTADMAPFGLFDHRVVNLT